jgi:hypothetical protein
LSSRKLRCWLHKEASQCKTMLFEHSKLSLGSSQHYISKNRDCTPDYQPSKQL